MILSHFLRHDNDVRSLFVTSRACNLTLWIFSQALLRTIRAWPHDIYDVAAVILAIQGQIERKPNSKVLMESVAELFVPPACSLFLALIPVAGSSSIANRARPSPTSSCSADRASSTSSATTTSSPTCRTRLFFSSSLTRTYRRTACFAGVPTLL